MAFHVTQFHRDGVVSQFGVGHQQRGPAQTAEFKQRFAN